MVPDCGAAVPGNSGLSVVVNVTGWLTIDGLNEEDATVVVVGEGCTVWFTLADVDVPKLESPLYTAETLRGPCVRKAPRQAGKTPLTAGPVVQSATLGLVVVSKK